MTLLKTLFNRKWWWVTLVVVVGMAVLARLGIWQLDRLDERRAANAQLAAALDAPPFALTADFLPSDPTTLKDHWVTASGAYDFDYQGIIKLQNFQGQAGVYLVAPLVLEDGATAVLVNRGWLPVNETNLSQFDEPGAVTVEGYAALSETLSRGSRAEATDLEWFRLDIEQIETQLPYNLLPIYIVETGETADLPIHLQREIDLSEGPHLGYAIQWVSFCLMLGVGYVFYVRRSTQGT
jgi:surfeit locus 1 family protein